MTDFFKDRPIKIKLTLISMFSTAVSLILTGATLIIYEHSLIKNELVTNVKAIGKIIADRSTAALTFQDYRLAEENLAALHVKPSIIAACVLNDSGEAVARYQILKSLPIPFPLKKFPGPHRFQYDYLILSEPIILENKPIGSVQILASLEEYYSKRHYFMLLVGIIILFSTLVAFFLTSHLQMLVSRPLMNLKETVQLITTQKDYSLRAGKKSGDEIGILVQAFNDMLEMIETQNRELKDSEAHYRYLFEQNPLPMLIYELGSLAILAVNDAFVAHYGYSKTEALALHLPDLYPEPEKEPIAKLTQQLHGHAYAGEWHHLKKDRTQITITAHSHGISFEGRTARIAVINDITERRQMELALRKNEELYRILFNNTGTATTLIEENTIISLANSEFEKLSGFSKAEIEGKKSWTEFVLKEDLDWMKSQHALRRETQEKAPRQYEFRFVAREGNIRNILLTVDIIPGTKKSITSLLDITERKLAEMEIKKLNAELEQRVTIRTSQLEASNKELEAFSYSVSHDLRAPLRHASGYVDLLTKKFLASLPDKAQHYLKSVEDSVRQMGILIDDLLQFSRTGRMEMRQKNVNMNEILQEVLGSIKHDLGNRAVEWVTGDLPPVRCDEAMVKLVWMNLLSNAVKFSRTRETARIEIGCRKEEKAFVFFVSDNGVGFDMKYAHKLFGVFQRLHTMEEFEGTGIGLANAQRIIIRHGGRVWAEAELDKGATFYFTLLRKQEMIS